MKPPCQAYDDEREIAGITFNDDSEVAVGRNGITRIVCYRENGQAAHLPVLAVYRGAEICARVPAWMVAISYVTKETPDAP